VHSGVAVTSYSTFLADLCSTFLLTTTLISTYTYYSVILLKARKKESKHEGLQNRLKYNEQVKIFVAWDYCEVTWRERIFMSGEQEILAKRKSRLFHENFDKFACLLPLHYPSSILNIGGPQFNIAPCLRCYVPYKRENNFVVFGSHYFGDIK
jgi:hypothetical protein